MNNRQILNRGLLLSVVLSLSQVVSFVTPLAAVSEDSQVLAKGTWSKKTQQISGGWQIVERAGDRFLILDEQFETREAPDLKIVLSPLAIEQLNNGNALEGARIVGPLPSVQGRQEIRLPKDVDLNDFESVLIHCEKYTKLWGGASLR
jgi:hypothetical protein